MNTVVEEKKPMAGPIVAGKSDFPELEIDKAEMMKKMEAAGAPGPGHKLLHALEGIWNAEVKCWMEPGGSPEVTQGTANARLIFNGRFLEEDFHGLMMGKPFAGRTLLGFDNTKQTYNSVWICDAQTSMFISESTEDVDERVITMEGKSSCPATGRTDIPMKTVLRVLSHDRHVFEMFDGSDGLDVKKMEITYTRQ